VPLKEDFNTWKIIRTPDIIVMLFNGVEFGRKTRSEVMATNYPHSSTMFDAEMRVIFNVAVGGGFTGIGNRAPDMSTWDKATMEIDYIRTSDDQTVPDAPPSPPSSCMDTVVCDSDSCASCNARVDWLMAHRGKTRDQAKTQVAQEFPDKCDCDSDCMNKMACDGSSCYTCGDRIAWLEANEGMTKNEAKKRVEREFPVDCKCGAETMLAFSLEVPEENLRQVEENAQPNTESTAAIQLSVFEFVAGLVGGILFCCAVIAICTSSSHKEETKEATVDCEQKDVLNSEDHSDVVLQEIFENEM